MAFSFGLSTILLVSHWHAGLDSFFTVRVKLVNFVVFAFVLFAWHCVFSLCGFYISQRLTSRMSLAIDTAKATTLASLVLLVIARLFMISMVSSSFMLFFWLTSSVVVIT